MNERLRAERELLSSPGDDILETIEHLKMSQAQLAERMGKTAPKIHDLITGKEPITTATALQLEKVLGVVASFWLSREALYREKLARLEAEEQIEANLQWIRTLPLKELVACGQLSSYKASGPLVEEALKFFGVASPKEWQKVYESEVLQHVDFRKSEKPAESVAAITAWMRVGELDMRKLHLAEFDKEQFKNALDTRIKQLVKEHPADFAQQLQEICASCGVALVYTPCFPKVPISGASRWFGGHPLIQLSDRYKTNDQFWFTFYHEAGHILLHGKKDVFLESEKAVKTQSNKEEEADGFAAKKLLPEKAIEELPNRFTEDDVVGVAERWGTHPGIVVGRVQYLGMAPYSFGNRYKERVNLFE
jgi:HTH-type transcriptional regulator / antitoxin HigA